MDIGPRYTLGQTSEYAGPFAEAIVGQPAVRNQAMLVVAAT